MKRKGEYRQMIDYDQGIKIVLQILTVSVPLAITIAFIDKIVITMISFITGRNKL